MKKFILFFMITTMYLYPMQIEDKPGSSSNGNRNPGQRNQQLGPFYQQLNRHRRQIRNQDCCCWCGMVTLFSAFWLAKKYFQHDHQD